jgi:hypothetical protein
MTCPALDGLAAAAPAAITVATGASTHGFGLTVNINGMGIIAAIAPAHTVRPVRGDAAIMTTIGITPFFSDARAAIFKGAIFGL